MKHRPQDGCSAATGVSPIPPTRYSPSPLTPKWVEAIGVVSFDLELGQTLTHLFPPLPLSIPQETDLAFLCFPDTNHTEYGHSLHHFIFPMKKKDYDITRITVARMPHSTKLRSVVFKGSSASSASHGDVCDEECFCSAIYLQRKDASNERGTQQRALVLISVYAFPKIFETILMAVYSLVLESYDVSGKLEALYYDIDSWPVPLPTRLYTGLHLLGKSLQSFRTPYYTSDRLGSHWREDGLGRETKCFLARRHLLEALESPRPDLAVRQKRLERSLHGPSAIEGMGDYIEKQLGLPLDVAAWRHSDVLAAIEAIRMRKYEKVDLIPPTEEVSEGSFEKVVNDDVRSILYRFPQGCCVAPEVAVIQNKELRQCRRLAKRLLSEHSDSAVDVDESDAATMFSEFDVQSILLPHLNRLWKLWELLLTGESLCVLGSNLRRTSAACFCLVSLLAPLPLSIVLRPYVTINSSEVDHILPHSGFHRPVLLGATNPFFLRHWMNSPHVLCLGAVDSDALQTHKTLPLSSLKSRKCQFDVKTHMFSSKHFLIRTEKHVWDVCAAKTSSVGILASSTTELASSNAEVNVDHDNSVRQTFYKLTKEFLLPLEWAVGIEFEKSRSLLGFYDDDDVPSSVEIFKALERCNEKKLPLHMFKGRRDMFKVYQRFMNTSTYNCWLRQRLFTLRRALLLRSSSLEAVLLLEPDPCRRCLTLMSLQYMLDVELKKPLLDVVLLKKLLYLTKNMEALRTLLSTADINEEGVTNVSL
ncbi:protein DENND6A-like isoform X1 [Trypanosoma conorhini]|uniref:Protein DENND6A-like isoform X1 n=1 Tax=Trypanosoma conorhini TaxID=83891 RepID=A0A3R7MN68_9TRYP|nr:protein DENND6A-like isoform X1 [Trypanosoma conorhini]RNF08600.1 protein DENND6A-like isoform X1 [Trypanosoma conorhini]